jgi:hypothetical protein
MRIAARILNSQAKRLCLADLGCGSGRLFELLERERFARLIGVDVSEAAIREASRKFDNPSISFSCVDITQDALPDAECFVALGLLDWLSDPEIKDLFSKLGDRHFLFSFSEKRSNLMILIHAIFLKLTGSDLGTKLRPRYQSLEEIRLLLSDSQRRRLRVYRHRSMAFGTLITDLPGAQDR